MATSLSRRGSAWLLDRSDTVSHVFRGVLWIALLNHGSRMVRELGRGMVRSLPGGIALCRWKFAKVSDISK